MFIIIASTYCLIGGLLTIALLTDKETITNKQDILLYLFFVFPLWPLAIIGVTSFTIFKNIQEKLNTKRRTRNDLFLRFNAKLYKMKLISRDTLLDIQQRITK